MGRIAWSKAKRVNEAEMKIGDEVYVHGYVDEIRNDVIIIRNEGGYFGTVPSEVNCSEKRLIDESNSAE